VTATGTQPVLEAARAAASKKGERIVILDVSVQLVITDYFVICNGSSERQVRTIADEVERRVAETCGMKPARREGGRQSHWVVLDFVDFVVHVFLTEERDYYDLERLWSDAPEVAFTEQWEEGDEPAAAKAT
jgi:ribosome-associated protein